MERGWLIENDSLRAIESGNSKCIFSPSRIPTVSATKPEDKQQEDGKQPENKHDPDSESDNAPEADMKSALSAGKFRGKARATFSCHLPNGHCMVGIANKNFLVNKDVPSVTDRNLHVIDPIRKTISNGAKTFNVTHSYENEEEMVIEIEVEPESKSIKYWIDDQLVFDESVPVFNWIEGSEYVFICSLNTAGTWVRLSCDETPPQTVLRSKDTDWEAVWHANRMALKYAGPTRTLVVGPVRAGKSTFINTVLTALQPKQNERVYEPVMAHKLSGAVELQTLTQLPGITPAPGAITQKFTAYKLRGTKATIADPWGWSLAPRDATTDAAIQAAIDKAVSENDHKDPDGTIKQLPFLTRVQLQSMIDGLYLSGASLTVGNNDPYYREEKPPLSERIHCLVIVIPYMEAKGYIPQVKRLLSYTEGKLNRRLVLLTKIDLNPKLESKDGRDPLSGSYMDPVQRAYHSPELDAVITQFAKDCMLSVRDVLPVQLYSGQRTRHRMIDALVLDAMLAAVNHGMDYCEKFCEKHAPKTCLNDCTVNRNIYKYKVPLPRELPLSADTPINWAQIEAGRRRELQSMIDFLVPLGFSEAIVRGAFISANGNGQEACKFLLLNSATTN